MILLKLHFQVFLQKRFADTSKTTKNFSQIGHKWEKATDDPFFYNYFI